MAAFREDQVFLARVAEQAGRYEDMAECVSHLVTAGQELTFDERCLFSLAFRNVVGTRRSAWRALATLEHQEASAGGVRASKTESIRNYRSEIEAEIRNYSNRVIKMVDEIILPAVTTLDNRVYFYKLKGDYNRYLAEISKNQEHKNYIEATHECYKLASDIALQELTPTHPTRLGLALNFSVFYYELLNSPERACLLAKAAFDDALAVMDNLDEQQYKDAATIMQLLRDNLTLWTSDMVPSVVANH